MQEHRSLYPCPASIFQKGRLSPQGSCHLLPPAALMGMARFITHWAVMGLCILKPGPSLEQGAGFISTDSPSLLPSRAALRQGSCHTKGPACSHPSSPCQTTLGSGKELKQPNRPLLFNNFGAFHNPPYHAANSCARALAAARGDAQPGRCAFSV